jgi:predicted DNA-binding helix-hairpin-helix protein
VSGLFLSSAVRGSPDGTMERINRVAFSLRRARFRGYIHLKIIPGASDAAIEQALGLATAVSLNIETAGEANFGRLDTGKEYLRDIVRPMRLIGALTARGRRYAGVKQTTQFVVGAAQETDADLIRYTWRLYKGLGLARVYFSAYQSAAGSPALAPVQGNRDLLMREHRLYQADWLIRKYGFRADEIPLGPDGNLSLEADPKEIWARAHPEFFPVAVNTDDAARLLRVPGIGQVAAARILALRREGARFRSPEDLARAVVLRRKAVPYLSF